MTHFSLINQALDSVPAEARSYLNLSYRFKSWEPSQNPVNFMVKAKITAKIDV